MLKNRHAVELGKLGGRSQSEAKAAAARENGKKGGRQPKLRYCKSCRRKVPKKHNPCGKYGLIAPGRSIGAILQMHGG